MGNQQTADSHDFGPKKDVEIQNMHNTNEDTTDASSGGSPTLVDKRSSITSQANIDFLISGKGEDPLWVQGSVKEVQDTDHGKVYTVENYASNEDIQLERSSIRTHDSDKEQWGDRQRMHRQPTMSGDGLLEIVKYRVDKARKGYGFAGWHYTVERLKAHITPVCICIVFVIIWIIMAQYDVLKYEDDGTISDAHRRALEGTETVTTGDPCDHRRILEAASTGTTHSTPDCTKTVPVPGDAYLVGAVICCCVVFLLMEYPGWVVMILGGTVLTLSDTITEKAMWHAMGFPTVIACCSVTAVAKGLANTQVLKKVMEKIIDFNHGDFFTLTMLFMITGLMSTLVDNFAVIGIFQYVYTVFGQKTGIDSKVLLISLSYISMIGGTCTVLASGAMLVAKSFLLEAPAGDFPNISEDQKVLGMFEMSLAAFPVLFFSAPFLAWWAPFLFGKEKADVEEGEEDGLCEHGHTEHGFIMKWQIKRACDVAHLHKIENASYLWKEAVAESGDKGIMHINKDTEINPDDIVYILAPGDKINDLELHGMTLMEMNPVRSNRIVVEDHVIAEGIVDPDADFIGIPYGKVNSHIRHWHVIGKYHPEKNYPTIDFLNDKVKGGDIILLEGEHHALLENNHSGFIHIVEHDSDHHHDIYLFQMIMSGGCLLFIVICTILEVLSLLETVIISLVVLNQTGCLTIEEMLHKFKWRVLLLVSGAYAIAHAFVDTMLAEYTTQRLMDITDSDTGMLVVMYVLSVVLGLCFPPKAEIGMLYPICLTLAKNRPSLELKKLVIVVLQGTAIQLLTPNCPENSLIAEGYSFGDFLKCGAPLAVLSGLIFIPLLELSYG